MPPDAIAVALERLTAEHSRVIEDLCWQMMASTVPVGVVVHEYADGILAGLSADETPWEITTRRHPGERMPRGRMAHPAA